MMKILGAAALSILALATASEAGVDARERRQQQRIFQGARSGALTAREFARLERQQVRIHREEFRYRHNDGRLGPCERRDLRRDQNRASRNIYRQKHDRQQR
jgi:hypothetical protein